MTDRRLALLAGLAFLLTERRCLLAEGAQRLVPRPPKLSVKIPANNSDELEWSPDGAAVAFVTKEESGRERVRCGDWASNDFERVTVHMLNHGGSTPVFLVKDGDRQRVVVGDRVGEPWDDVEIPAVSPGAKHVACRSVRGGEHYVVVDEVTSGPYEEVVGPYLSPDGSQCGWWVKRDSRYDLVVNGKSVLEGQLSPRGCTWSPDGKRLGYATSTKEGMRCVAGDRTSVLFKSAWAPTWSEDGSSFTFRASHALGEFNMFGDKPGRVYPHVYGAALSRDGKSWAYLAEKNGTLLVVNEREIRDFEMYSHPSVSADGKHVAYAGTKGEKTRLVIDDWQSPEYDAVWWPVFSLDGRHVAARAKKGEQWVILVDRIESPPYDWIEMYHLRFTKDGKSVEFAIQRDGNAEWAVLDVE